MQHENAAPDLIVADYRLPNGLTGLQLVESLRQRFDVKIPAVVLTGDISSTTLREIANRGCHLLSKPIKLSELRRVIQSMLTA